MTDQSRFEFKYQLNTFEYLKLKNNLKGFAFLDFYSKRSQGKYFIRSLYYDTYDYRAYGEKVTGEQNRIKLRIRTYMSAAQETEFVSVELKTRHGNKIAKFSTHAPYADYMDYLNTGLWRNPDPVLIEFDRLRRLQALRPKVLVDYEREAYLPKDRSSVRITFDHHMRYALATELYPKKASFRCKDSGLIILEFKFADDDHHLWLEKIVAQHGLQSVPNSKYVHGIEQTQQAMFFK